MTHAAMAPTDFSGELTERENRAEVCSLEALHVERRQLMPLYCALKALHGPANNWDKRRKCLLSAIKIRVRMSPAPSGKWTDAGVDDAAHADEQYVRFVDEGIATATQYAELDIRMTEISERIDDRRNGLFLYSAEAKLT